MTVIDTPPVAQPPAAASPLTRRATLWLLAALLGVTAAIFGLAVLVIAAVPGARAHAVSVLALTLPVHTIALLAVLGIGLRRAGSGWRELGFTRPGWRLAHLLWQIPALVVAVLLTQGVVAAVLQRDPTPAGGGLDGLLGGASPALIAIALVCVVTLVPIWEEAVFRGLIHGGLRRRWGVLASTAVSASAFALAHGVPVLLPYMLMAGIGLALLREFHRTLWAPVIAHGTINALASTALLAALLS